MNCGSYYSDWGHRSCRLSEGNWVRMLECEGWPHPPRRLHPQIPSRSMCRRLTNNARPVRKRSESCRALPPSLYALPANSFCSAKMIVPPTFIETIRVRPAITEDERNLAFGVRLQGYEKYGFTPTTVADAYDHNQNCTILLATMRSPDTGEEVPAGTLRILDAWNGRIELEDCIPALGPLDDLNRNFAEATRFSVIKCPERTAIKLALWKAFHRFCLGIQRNHMVVWVRSGGRRDYESLGFSECPVLSFSHETLGGRPHTTFMIDLVDLEQRYRTERHPLHSFIFHEHHPLIRPF